MSEIELISEVGKFVGGGYALKKLVGPTLDLLGERGRDLTERGFNNIGAVFSNALSKVPDLDADGSIPPRALKAVVDQAAWAEDEVFREYLGGVLASARTPFGRDDRAGIWATRLGGLSTYTLRLHFLFYTAAHRAMAGKDINLNMAEDRDVTVFASNLHMLLGLDIDDGEDLGLIVSHSLPALHDEGLIRGQWAYGSEKSLERPSQGSWIPCPGWLYTLSHRGIELFLTAQGRFRGQFADFLDPELNPDDLNLFIPRGRRIKDLREVPKEHRYEVKAAMCGVEEHEIPADVLAALNQEE